MDKYTLQQLTEIDIIYRNPVPKESRIKIQSSNNAAEVFRLVMDEIIEYKEFMYAMLLNNSNDVLTVTKLSEGGITGTLADIRILFQKALKAHATAFILCHNHPSGTLIPSKADEDLTKKVRDAGKFLDIKLLDHIILTRESYYSFADNSNIL